MIRWTLKGSLYSTLLYAAVQLYRKQFYIWPGRNLIWFREDYSPETCQGGGGGASPLFTLYSLFFFSLLLSVSSLSLSVSISLYIYLLLSIPPLVPSLPSPCLISIVSSLFLNLSLLYRVSFFLSSSLSCFIYISVSSSFLYILSLSQLYLLLSSFTLSLLPHLMWVSINASATPHVAFFFKSCF